MINEDKPGLSGTIIIKQADGTEHILRLNSTNNPVEEGEKHANTTTPGSNS